MGCLAICKKGACAQFSVCTHDGLVVFGKVHTHSALSLGSLPTVALQTVPMFVCVYLENPCSVLGSSPCFRRSRCLWLASVTFWMWRSPVMVVVSRYPADAIVVSSVWTWTFALPAILVSGVCYSCVSFSLALPSYSSKWPVSVQCQFQPVTTKLFL